MQPKDYTTHVFHDGVAIHRELKSLELKTIAGFITQAPVPAHIRKSRRLLYHRISALPMTVQDVLRTRCVLARETLRQAARRPHRPRRAVSQAAGSRASSSSRSSDSDVDAAEETSVESASEDERDIPQWRTRYLKEVPEHIRQAAISRFIEATGSKAARSAVCCVCAREVSSGEALNFSLDEIPNHHRLQPHMPHPEHTLFNGELFHAAAVTVREGVASGDVCDDCQRDLRSQRDTKPTLSLANNMWIGSIPHQLQTLTMTEKLLVSLYYPAVQVVKLYPKKDGARGWDTELMHDGMTGNVSSYPLNINRVDDMLSGSLLPRPPETLSSVLAVTVVGPRNFPERTFPGLFRVRRQKVKDALVWLKANNPLYSEISIDEQRLSSYPENDVPEVVYDILRHETDTSVLETEHAFAPEDPPQRRSETLGNHEDQGN